MKIIYLHQYFIGPSKAGGTRSYDLARTYVSQGHSVTILSATGDKNIINGLNKWHEINLDGVIVKSIYVPYANQFSLFRRVIAFVKFIWYASIQILKLDGDVVIASSTPLTIGIPALIRKFFKKTPYIFEVRDVWPEAVIAIGAIKNRLFRKLLFGLEKLIYHYASVIVPLSTDMQNSIITRYPEYASKAEIVIENISEIARFAFVQKSLDLSSFVGFKPRFSVLYAGTFGKVNAIHEIVKLASLTINLDPFLVYILIGDGAYKEQVIEFAEERKVLNRNLFIFDPVPKRELPLWYGAASMGSSFVADIPELWSNSANKFFDTLAAAKPILINYRGWQSEIIKIHNIGYVLPVEITSEVAADFVRYTRMTDIHNLQCLSAFDLASSKYSLTESSRKYLNILQGVFESNI